MHDFQSGQYSLINYGFMMQKLMGKKIQLTIQTAIYLGHFTYLWT